MRRICTDEQIAYLREIAPGRYLDEITSMMNERFNLTLTGKQVHQLKSRQKIKSGTAIKTRKYKRLLTQEQHEYLQANAAGKSSIEIIEMLKEQFGITLTVEQIKTYKNNHKIRSGLTGHFEKGHTPPNKGKKMPAELYAKCAKTMFKKGNRPPNTVPAGTELEKGDGYIWVKIAEPNKWRQKHVLIWEAANGPRPKGHKILFADRNRRNFDLDNLICVSNAELARLNQYHLLFDNAETTKAGVLCARLKTKAAELKRRKNQQ